MKRILFAIMMVLWVVSSWGQNVFFDGFETGNTQDAAITGWTQESIAGTNVWSANTSSTNYNRTPRTGSWNAYLRYSNTDWMFKSVALTSGTNYILTFYARQDVTSGCNILASFGTTATSAGMTNPIVASTPVTSGDYQYFSGTFTPATTETFYIGIRADLDYSPWYISIDDISLDVLPELPPSCATIVSPADAATDIPISTSLNWASGGGAPTGYKLYFGTDNPPTNIENGTDLGNVTSFDPSPDMNYSTEYFWQVVAYNDYGDAETCPVWSFTTMDDPTITSFPYTEGFEGPLPSTWMECH